MSSFQLNFNDKLSLVEVASMHFFLGGVILTPVNGIPEQGSYLILLYVVCVYWSIGGILSLFVLHTQKMLVEPKNLWGTDQAMSGQQM